MSLSLSDSPESLHAVDKKIKSDEESTQALKYYRNSLVPISSLPDEVLTTIFSFGVALPSFEGFKSPLPTTPFSISHVCHRWREISLNLTHLWSQIDFTKLTPAGTAEMLARAKMAPLHLEAVNLTWGREKFKAFKRQIKAHIHHTRHLSISAPQEQLQPMLKQLVSSAPSLEQFSVTNLTEDRAWQRLSPVIRVPDKLFGGIAPKLIYLRLNNCEIPWGSPLIGPVLKGLRDLKLYSYPKRARIACHRWVDALNQMPQLERLTLHDGVPFCSEVSLSVNPGLTVVLPSLTELDISASAGDCRVVLAHLVLPVLTRLFIKAETNNRKGRDVQYLIPYVVRNTHRVQDTEPLQSLFIGGDKSHAEIVAWNAPGKDTNDGLCSSAGLPDGIHLARVAFSTVNKNWRTRNDIPLYDALLTALPLNSIASLTVKGGTPLTGQVWRNHAPRWHKLRRVRLFPTAVPAFRGVIKDALSLGPLLPSLEELVLVNVALNAAKVYYLNNMLNDLVELKIPLKTLDLRTCIAFDWAVQILSKLVVDVQVPVKKKSDEERQESMEIFGEEGAREGGSDGGEDGGSDEGEEGSSDEGGEGSSDEGEDGLGLDDVPPLQAGSWDIDDDDNFYVDNGARDSD
jgi:hypothetical protein